MTGTALTADSLQDGILVRLGSKTYRFDSLPQASQFFCAARDRSGLGGSKMPTPRLIDATGKTVGYISYNGRIWPGLPTDWNADKRPIYDNREG